MNKLKVVQSKINDKASSFGLSRIYSDTLLLAGLSALSYLVAYRYEVAYLDYFSIDEQFVDLSLERVAQVVSVLVGVGASAYYSSNLISLFTTQKVRLWLLSFRFELIFWALTAFFYWLIGTNWLVFGMILISVGLVVGAAILITIEVWKRRPLNDWLSEKAKPPNRDKFPNDLDDRIIQKFGIWTWIFIPLALYLIPTFATVVGNFQAEHRRKFDVYTHNGRDYLLIAQKSDVLAFSEISGAHLTANVLLMKVSPTEPVSFTETTFQSGFFRSELRHYRPSLLDWFRDEAYGKLLFVPYER